MDQSVGGCWLCGESGIADEVADGGLVSGGGGLAGLPGGALVPVSSAGRIRPCTRVRNMAVCRPGAVAR